MIEIVSPFYIINTEITAFWGKLLRSTNSHISSESRCNKMYPPPARVTIWWQAVGGGEDESCQWRPLKRTTHSPVTGEAWWMIISRCDRCCDGGGALTIRPSPAAPPPPPRLPPPLSAYLGQCFNTPLTWLYWHTPDSVWWLMSMWVPLSLSLPLPLSFFLAFSAPHLPVILFSLSEQYSLAYLTHKAIIARPVTHTRTQRLTHAKTHICGGVHIQKLICTGREWTYITPNLIL